MRLTLLSLMLLLAAAPAGAETSACPKWYGVTGAASEEQSAMAELRSLYAFEKKSPELTENLNRRVIHGESKKVFLERRSNGRAAAFSAPKIDALFERVNALPEVKESICGSYRGSGKTGYCYARALAVHLEALRSGIDKRAIRKVWMVGDLDLNGSKWNFHVATMIHSAEGGWQVLDPVLGKKMSLEAWYRTMRNDHDPSGTARLFTTDARRLLPYGPEKYEKAQLNRPLFRGFFRDLFNSMREADPRIQK